MIKSFFAVDEEPEEKETGIDWLDIAIALANTLFAHWLIEIERASREKKLETADNG